MRRRAEFYYQQLDALRCLRQQVRRDLLAESKKHQAWKRLCGIPSIGPIRAAVLLGILQTPDRFRTNRQLWTYGGVGIETSSSADHHFVKGQLERKKKVEIRGLNRNYNHDLKNLFKGAAIVAATKPGPFAEFYAQLLAKGIDDNGSGTAFEAKELNVGSNSPMKRPEKPAQLVKEVNRFLEEKHSQN